MTFEYSRQISKITHIYNFMKAHEVGAQLFHADRWADRQI